MPNSYIGHGRHWSFIQDAGMSEEHFMELCHEIAQDPDKEVLYRRDDISLVGEADGELGIGLLMNGERICSAFPYVDKGHVWPIEINDVYEWPDPLEAQLIGNCHGAAISWFDCLYWAYHEKYQNRTTPLNFEMNALAYNASPTQFSSNEARAIMSQMKSYLPLHDQDGFVAGKDEIQFTSSVEGVRTVDFYEIPFDVYTITIALPEDFPMRLNLYVSPSAAERTFVKGDLISGVCWLFGKLRWTNRTGLF